MAPFGASRAGLMSVAEDDIPDSVEYQWVGGDYDESEGEWTDRLSNITLTDDEGSPTLESDQINGEPAVRYDGGEQSISNSNALDEDAPLTVFIVSDLKNNETDDMFWGDVDDLQTFFQDEGGGFYRLRVNDNSLETTDRPAEQGWQIREAVLGGSGDEIIRESGEELESDDISSAGLSGFIISGRSEGDTSRMLEQDVAEVTILVDPTEDETTQERERLSSKYGIPLD